MMTSYLKIVVLSSFLIMSRTLRGGDKPLTDLAAGQVNFKFSLCGSLIGLGSTASLVGESVVWKQSDASSVAWNPAALGFLERRSVLVDWVPRLSQNIADYYDVNKLINDQMDGVLDEYGSQASSVRYPAVSAEAGLQSSLAGFSLALPFTLGGRPVGLGFCYSTPLLLNLTARGSGIEAGIDSEQEIQDEIKRIRMRMWLDFDAALQVRVHQLQFGVGYDLGRRSALGVSVSYFRFRVLCRAFADIGGIIEMSGSEYAFNDPYDAHLDFAAGEQNDLHQSFYADVTGRGWGVKLGATTHITRSFLLGVTFGLSPRFSITGVDSSVNNVIPFLRMSLDGGDIDDVIDPTKIDLAKLTKTKKLASKNYFRPSLELPNTLNIGCMWGSNRVNVALRYTRYRGVFSLGLLEDEIRGLQLHHGLGVGLDCYYFFIGASANLADEILPFGENGEPMLNIIIPKVNLGIRIPFASSLWCDGLIGIEPTPLLRITFRYSF